MHLFAQMCNMGHDGIVAVLIIVLAPERFKKLLGGDNGSLSLAQVPDNRKF